MKEYYDSYKKDAENIYLNSSKWTKTERLYIEIY